MRRNVMTDFVKAACDMHLLQVGLCKALNFAMQIEEQAELPMIEGIPEDIEFKTKSEIALEQIRWAREIRPHGPSPVP